MSHPHSSIYFFDSHIKTNLLVLEIMLENTSKTAERDEKCDDTQLYFSTGIRIKRATDFGKDDDINVII